MSKETKNYIAHGSFYLLLFCVLPFWVSKEQEIAQMLMYLFPTAVTVMSGIFVKMFGFAWPYFLLAPICYLPSTLLFASRFEVYKNGGYIYVLVILLFSFIGAVIGYILEKVGRMGDRSAMLTKRNLRK